MTNGFTRSANTKGFTLIELLFTVAIAAILMMIAAPSFDQIIRNNKVRTQTNNLISALQEARTEAVKRGKNVTVCRSTAAASTFGTCTNNVNDKLIIFIDSATGTAIPVVPTANSTDMLRKFEAIPSSIQIVTNATYIRFNNLGMAANLVGTGGTTIRLEDEECAAGDSKAKEISISEGGQVSLKAANCVDDS
jgi:type IV fimbrial biogenesis protein FimT